MATITEDYVSFETAKLLKEKGFHEECKCQYGRHSSISWTSCNNGNVITFARPTLQMAMKWLREVHKLFIEININVEHSNYYSCIYKTVKNGFAYMYDMYKAEIIYYTTYEEAVEAAIKYCLEDLI